MENSLGHLCPSEPCTSPDTEVVVLKKMVSESRKFGTQVEWAHFKTHLDGQGLLHPTSAGCWDWWEKSQVPHSGKSTISCEFAQTTSSSFGFLLCKQRK